MYQRPMDRFQHPTCTSLSPSEDKFAIGHLDSCRRVRVDEYVGTHHEITFCQWDFENSITCLPERRLERVDQPVIGLGASLCATRL